MRISIASKLERNTYECVISWYVDKITDLIDDVKALLQRNVRMMG